MIATGPPGQRWLLIEREGAWPARALDVFDSFDAYALSQKAAAYEARISLIRRPRRHPRMPGVFRWAIADIRPGSEGIRWSEAESVEEIIADDWHVSPGQGDPVAIVCAHSKHDVCCALRGRPVAAALEPMWPGQVWECSHLGGDRFAANMVVLPHGLCFGRVDAGAGFEILDAYHRGELLAEHLRGRSAYTRQEQAADCLARVALGHVCIAGLRPVMHTADGAEFSVSFTDPTVTIRVREREVRLGSPATCRALGEGAAFEYDLLGIE
jgi:hypothetical protein